jgi:hypothetical protein
MDSDRKYRQPGYMDSERDARPTDRPKPAGPRPPIDVTGPRLPRLVQHEAAARCFNCATALPVDVSFTGNCPKCNAELHCCKQCSHFEPSNPILVPQANPGEDPTERQGKHLLAVQPARNNSSRRHGRRATSVRERGTTGAEEPRGRKERLRQAI